MQSSDFVNHSYDYRPNWTPLSPVTITNSYGQSWDACCEKPQVPAQLKKRKQGVLNIENGWALM